MKPEPTEIETRYNFMQYIIVFPDDARKFMPYTDFMPARGDVLKIEGITYVVSNMMFDYDDEEILFYVTPR